MNIFVSFCLLVKTNSFSFVQIKTNTHSFQKRNYLKECRCQFAFFVFPLSKLDYFCQMSTFRFVTVNVFSFRHPEKYESNLTDLVSIFSELNLDLIAVQEIQDDDKWKKFRSRLGFDYSACGMAHRKYFGNGFACRHPIICSENQVTDSYPGGKRAFLQCSLQGFEQIQFAVTHLDHLNEDCRLSQIAEFQPNEKQIDILMGDFNALTRNDYSDRYYQNIVEGKRRQSGWELPRFDLTNLLTNEWKYEDVFRIANPELKDEDVSTCAYGTRIDYVFLHPRLTDRFFVNKCEIIDTKGVTDHNAVFVELKSK